MLELNNISGNNVILKRRTVIKVLSRGIPILLLIVIAIIGYISFENKIVNSNQEESLEDSGPSSFANWFSLHQSKINKIYTEYFNDIQVADLSRALDPNNLTKMSTAKQYKYKIETLLNKLPDYERSILEVIGKAEVELSKNSDEISKEAYVGFKETLPNGISNAKRYFAIQKGILSESEKILDLAIELNGNLSVLSGRLVLPDEGSKIKYNSYIDSLNNYNIAQNTLMEEQQKQVALLRKYLNSLAEKSTKSAKSI